MKSKYKLFLTKNIEEDAQGKPVTKKRRAIASWIDATLRPSEKTSTGPGCSICISTFEEIQMEGLEVLKIFLNCFFLLMIYQFCKINGINSILLT